VASIEERIVSMVFENAKFEAGVAKSMDTLKKFNESLGKTGQTTAFSDIDKAANKVSLSGPMSALDKLRSRLGGAGQGAAEGMGQIEQAGNKVTLEAPLSALDRVQSRVGNVGANAADGFNEIERASGRVSLEGLNSAMDSVTAKFSTLQAAASVAMGNITSQAAMKGASFAKSFALGPVTQGFQEYQTNLGSIQTILANTSDSGGNLKTVNAALGELNTYSDKTIYNFSEMAKNIGTFTAAGVQLKPATSAIKGIANLAALSGSNSQQASTAMYQLSQAIAAGRVGLQDWNSVVNAGMGGAVFQKALMRTAENMGALSKGAVKVDKATGKATVNGESFRNSIMAKPGEQSWLTSDVLTKTLSQFTGDMSDAQLAAQGFSQDQITAIQKQAKMAQDAATQVKTLPQVFDVARETIGSGWSQTFQLIFGDFGQSKKTFTELSNAINAFINKTSKARNDMLKTFDKLGGRTAIIAALKSAFWALEAALRPVAKAFRAVFPKQTAEGLLHFVDHFNALSDAIRGFFLRNGGRLENTFKGFFAVIHIGIAIVKGLIGVIARLFGDVANGSGGFLDVTANIGLFLTSVDQALTRGGLLNKFFDGLYNVIKKPLHVLVLLKNELADLFSGIKPGAADGVSQGMHGVTMAITPLDKALIRLKGAWAGFKDLLEQAKDLVSPWLTKIGDQLAKIPDAISNALAGDGFDRVISVVQTSLIGALFIAIKRAITGGSTELGGALKGINNVLHGLTGNLQAMQNKVKAQTIFQIAASIGILAAATYVLSTIDPASLAKAMTAIAVGLGELMGSMKLITGGLGAKGMATVPIIAAGMIAMSFALVVLAGAMKLMATMSWEDIGKGLTGIGGALAAIGIAMKTLGPGVVVQGPAMILLAVALNILALAVKQFASMKWEDMARGLAGILGVLVAIAGPMEAFGPSLVLVGPGLIAVSIALNALAGAVTLFGNMSLDQIVRGLLGIAASLTVIGFAISAIPPTAILQAGTLIALSVGLTMLAGAVGAFGHIRTDRLAKGLLGMGASLLILAAGLIAMEAGIPGSVALLAAAGALAILAPTLGFLGTLKWSTIFRGLGAIALVLGTLSVIGLLASEGLIALGAALLPFAIVMVAAGAGTLLFAKALQLMGTAGAKGVGVMITALGAFILLLPKFIISIVKGIIESIGEIANMAPKVLDALAAMLTTLFAFVIKEAPKFGQAFVALVGTILTVFEQMAPRLVEAGIHLLGALLTGLAQNVSQMTTNGVLIITRFLIAVAARAPDIAKAGGDVIIGFLSGINTRIGKIAAKATQLIGRFIGGVVSRLGDILGLGGRVLAKLLEGMGQNLERFVTAGARAIQHVLTGVGNAIGPVMRKAAWLARKFIHAFVDAMVSMVDIAFDGMVRFMNGLAKVIEKREGELMAAGVNLGTAVMKGMVKGIVDNLKHPVKTIKHAAGSIIKGAKDHFKSKSPSKVFVDIGGDLMTGLAMGIQANGIHAEKAMHSSSEGVASAARKAMSNVPNLLDGFAETNPTITPVLDLSQIEKHAGRIGEITDRVKPISAILSMGHAGSIVQEKAAADKAHADAAASMPSISFVQHNTSPEPLSTAEIYRRTNNQISQIRKKVGIPDRHKPR
jgi:tape measure domain-containing protein